MTIRRSAVALLAVPLLLAGCAGAQADTAVPHSASHDGPAAGAAGAGESPPDKAVMVCGGQVADSLTQILELDAPPHTVTEWADPVYTCTYHLPMGPLVLTVNVSGTDAAAGTFFDARAARTPGAEPVVGLGERAFGTDDGSVTVVKDDMTLTVDATSLPEVFGDDAQRRTAFAFEVASQVMGCWTEHGG
jgi:hypothetical protein